MREEHPLQQELPNIPEGVTAFPQVTEMSEVAALQAQVLDLGLVRESRPVFVYDSKLAKEKKGNAQRQAKHREKQAALGLVPVRVPQALIELVKNEHSGDWSKVAEALGKEPKISDSKASGGGDVVITEFQKIEITEAGGLDAWLQKKIDFSIASLPKVTAAPPQIIEKVIEKLIEKPVIKLTSEQRKAYELGKKAAQLRGWRSAVLAFLLK